MERKMNFKSVAEVLAAVETRQKELANLEKDAIEALHYLFQKRYADRRQREIVVWKEAFNFKPDPEDDLACAHPEMRGLLERVDFYPDRVEVQVCTALRWFDDGQHDYEEHEYETVTLFTGEKAQAYFEEVAKQFINQETKKGPATMLFTEPGLASLEHYLSEKKKMEAFHKEWEAERVRKREACGCDEPEWCDCTIPF